MTILTCWLARAAHILFCRSGCEFKETKNTEEMLNFSLISPSSVWLIMSGKSTSAWKAMMRIDRWFRLLRKKLTNTCFVNPIEHMRCPAIYKRNRVKLNWTICFEMQKWDNPSEGTRPLEMRNSTIAVPYKDLMLTKDLLDAQQLAKVRITVMNQQRWLDYKTIFHILCRQHAQIFHQMWC